MTHRGLAIGCGGTLGFAWTAATLLAVEESLGWDARDAEVLLGTSAGAEQVAVLGSGRSARSVVEALEGASGADPLLVEHVRRHPGSLPPLPRPGLPGRGLTAAALRGRLSPYTGLAGLLPRGRGDAGWLRELGNELAGPDGWVEHPATRTVAVDVASGERVAFGAPSAPPTSLGDAIAASWAIPGWFPPVEIAGRSFLDGGAASTASVDLLLEAGLDELVVLAPMSSEGGAPARGPVRVERLLRSQMTRGLDRETALLREAGVRVIRVEPGPEDLRAMGANFMDLSRREETLRTARRTAARRVGEAIAAAEAPGVPA